MHGAGNAMTLTHKGKITRTRAFKPERLWVGPSIGESMGPMSLAFCKETYTVLKERVRFEAAKGKHNGRRGSSEPRG